MTEAEIIKLFTDAGFMYRPEDDDQNILWFGIANHNIHVFRSSDHNVYFHINTKNFTFHQRFDLDGFPDTTADATDLIDKIKAIIKLYGE